MVSIHTIKTGGFGRIDIRPEHIRNRVELTVCRHGAFNTGTSLSLADMRRFSETIAIVIREMEDRETGMVVEGTD